MSRKKKRVKEGVPVRQIVLPTGVVSRFVKGVKEGAPERETLARLRRELEALPDGNGKGLIAKVTAVFCGQGRGFLMLTLCNSGRYQDNYIVGTPMDPVPLENLQVTGVTVRGAVADFQRGSSY